MTFLDRVVKQKLEEIARRKQEIPQPVLEGGVDTSHVRDFLDAVSGGGNIIAEVKKKTPRIDNFRQTANTNSLGAIYEENGACAISVVTDAANFGTSLLDAKRIREQVSVPVLVKDFVIDSYQVFDARLHDADAVLLIVRILPLEILRRLIALVHELGMQALVEVHSKNEMDRALEAGAKIVGINNRNLDTLEVNLDTTRTLAGEVSRDARIVSESGIRTRAEIRELSALGVNTFLIGGSLLDSDDPGRLLRELLGRTPSSAN